MTQQVKYSLEMATNGKKSPFCDAYFVDSLMKRLPRFYEQVAPNKQNLYCYLRTHMFDSGIQYGMIQ